MTSIKRPADGEETRSADGGETRLTDAENKEPADMEDKGLADGEKTRPINVKGSIDAEALVDAMDLLVIYYIY